MLPIVICNLLSSPSPTSSQNHNHDPSRSRLISLKSCPLNEINSGNGECSFLASYKKHSSFALFFSPLERACLKEISNFKIFTTSFSTSLEECPWIYLQLAILLIAIDVNQAFHRLHLLNNPAIHCFAADARPCSSLFSCL